MGNSIINDCLTTKKCRLCNSSNVRFIDTEIYVEKKYTIFKCNNCSLVYISEIYDEVSPDYINLTEVDDFNLWLQSEHKIDAFKQFLSLVKRYNLHFINTSKLLDIGCGTGGFLNYVSDKLSCQVFGFDSSLSQVNYANKKFPMVKCAISINEYLKEIGIPDIKFDIITLWDVLEHIRQPVNFLEDLTKQSNDGILFISVPNSLPMVIKNKLKYFKFFTWFPHEHVSYFSPKSLRVLSDILGLQVIDIGCVKVYKRKYSIFEFLRRALFFITSFFPILAPQIYLIAKTSNNGNK